MFLESDSDGSVLDGVGWKDTRGRLFYYYNSIGDIREGLEIANEQRMGMDLFSLQQYLEVERAKGELIHSQHSHKGRSAPPTGQTHFNKCFKSP